MQKDDDTTDVIESARFIVVAKANEWIGLPFDIQECCLYIYRLPQTIREEGFAGWFISALVGLGLMWFFAPLREFFFQLELAIAMFFAEIWLTFLPFILICAGFFLFQVLCRFVKRPSFKRAKVVSRAAIRFGLLAGTYLIDVWYGDSIRAFIERSDSWF